MRHPKLPKQRQWVRTNLLLVFNIVTKSGYFWRQLDVDLLLANLVGGFCPATFDNFINQEGPYGSSKVIGMRNFYFRMRYTHGCLASAIFLLLGTQNAQRWKWENTAIKAL